uniref:Syncoilin, intermediate filament protein n=1 Tax=Pundamilia nyererei TaxID=303518 RepID=A0A3B4EY11_9CICH
MLQGRCSRAAACLVRTAAELFFPILLSSPPHVLKTTVLPGVVFNGSRLVFLDSLMDDQSSVQDGNFMLSTDDSHVQLRFSEDISPSNRTDSETLGRFAQDPILRSEQVDMESLGELFEYCIQRVSHLERQRDVLIQELLVLQEPMLQVVGHLRAKLEGTRKLLALAQLDYVTVCEDVQQVKRKLFTTTRDCIQSQVKLAEQEYEVAQSACRFAYLTQELVQLENAHQNQLNSLRDQATKPCRPRAMSDISQCRQASIRLQRRLSGSVKMLEGWYEPRLMVLLKRRQVGEEALRKTREQAVDLRAGLKPLREEIQRLEVQRSCLEQRITLLETERQESTAQHKVQERLDRTDVQKSKKGLEDLKDGLLAELTFLRWVYPNHFCFNLVKVKIINE